MHFFLLDESDLNAIHDVVIGPNELQGLAADKSISAVLARLQNRLEYGFISDVHQYAACAGMFVAKAHCFNDANKRTAAAVMHLILLAHDLTPNFSSTDLGSWIVHLVEGGITEDALANLLKQSCNESST